MCHSDDGGGGLAGAVDGDDHDGGRRGRNLGQKHPVCQYNTCVCCRLI